jgi:hypothetical protein
MRTLLGGAAALVLLVLPAAAQADQPQNSQSKSVDPHQLAVQLKKPPLKLDDKKRAAIQNALVGQHTQQKTPKDFKPQVGAAAPKSLKVDVMPQALGRAVPEMKDYGYAKTAGDILVLDPMNRKIVAVIPRKYPNDAKEKSPTPVDWANAHAQEVTGKAPQGGVQDPAPEQGDAAAVGNGNAGNAQPQESGLQPGYQGQK